MKLNRTPMNQNAWRKSPMTKHRTDWRRIMAAVPGDDEKAKWEHLCEQYTYQEIADIFNGKRRKRGGISKSTVRKRAMLFGVSTGRLNRPRFGYAKLIRPRVHFNYLQYIRNVDKICQRDYAVTVQQLSDALMSAHFEAYGKYPSSVDVPKPIHLEALSMMED